jgi:hypothetical protein
LNVERIVRELKMERERLNRAIAALEEAESASTNGRSPVATAQVAKGGQGGQGRHLTPAGRKRLSEAMRRRWAERRKASKAS